MDARGGAIPDDVLSAVKNAATAARVAELLGVALKREGGHFKGRCPLPDHPKEQSGKTPPFTVYGGERGGWKCFSCGKGGGDGIALYQAVRGTDFPETIRALGLSLGISIDLPGNGNGSRPRATKPRPAAALAPADPAGEWTASSEPPASLKHRQHGEPSRVWRILDVAGRLFALHCRFELVDSKTFRWWRNGQWSLKCAACLKHPAKDCAACVGTARAPLYGSEMLAGWDQGAAVLVTEGEKAADALRDRGLHAVATVCGSGSTPGAAMLAVLSGRGGPVILWPDNDSNGKGRAHMEHVRAALPAGLDVRTFAPPDLPDKGDAVECLAARASEVTADGLLGEILAGAVKHRPAAVEDQGGDVATPGLTWQIWNDFCETQEPAPDALIGTPDSCFLAGDGLLLLYGKGGAGKTTFVVDLIAHAASGTPWHGLPIPLSLKCLVIENEGSRVQFRKKLKRKRDGWEGRPFDRNVAVCDGPKWGGVTLADERTRAEIAAKIDSFGADILILGPLARLGARGGGKPDDVTDFEELIQDIRERASRPFAVILVHHENKSGNVSGAWDRAPETFLHLKRAGGRCVLHLEKVRDSSELHDQTWNLTLVPPDGFQRDDVPPPRDYERDILAFLATLADGERCSQAAIVSGIKAGVPYVRATLETLTATGAIEKRVGGPGVSANTHGYRLAGPCLKPSDTGKHGEQGTPPGVSGVGACLPCPSPGRGHGERYTRTRHPAARVSPCETADHGDSSEDDGGEPEELAL